MLRVSVIVPARNAQATLPRTLEALSQQRLDEDYEVIVVDDGSTDATAELARCAPGPVTVLRQDATGPAAARNLGAARARGQVLAFCDADVFPAPGWLRAGAAALAGADLVQGQVLPDPGAALGPFDRSLWITSEVGLWETANLFVTRELFVRVGGFEEWIRPRRGKALAEDVWFGYRAVRAGARTGFCAEALAHHAVFPRGPRAYASERARLRYFPAMAGKMPELRRTFLHARVFLNRRSAAFDLGLAGAAAATVLRSPLPLAAAVPYARAVRAHARRSATSIPSPSSANGVPWPAIAAVDIGADLVGFAALAYGSVRYRSVVI